MALPATAVQDLWGIYTRLFTLNATCGGHATSLVEADAIDLIGEALDAVSGALDLAESLSIETRGSEPVLAEILSHEDAISSELRQPAIEGAGGDIRYAG